MPENELTNDIMKKIGTARQRPQWYFIMRNIGFFLGIILLIVLGSVSLGSFWIDIRELQLLANESGLEWTSILSQAMFELVLLATVGIGVAYLVYRQTDWFLVRHKGALVAGFSIFILLGALFYIFIYTLVGRNAPIRRGVIDNSMMRPNRRQMLDDRLQGRGIYEGVVEKLEPSMLTIRSIGGYHTFQIDHLVPGLENIIIGDRIIVRADKQNNLIGVRVLE